MPVLHRPSFGKLRVCRLRAGAGLGSGQLVSACQLGAGARSLPELCKNLPTE